MQINLGELCSKCSCSNCKNREKCGTTQGNTDDNCHRNCKGEVGYMKNCSRYEEGGGVLVG